MQLRAYNDEIKEFLETQVLSKDARSLISRQLTRALSIGTTDHSVVFVNKMSAYNVFANVCGLLIATFEPEDDGYYDYHAEAWLDNRLLLAIRRASALELYQSLADLMTMGVLDVGEINYILEKDNLLVQYIRVDYDFYIERTTLIDDDQQTEMEEHPNMQILLDRAYTCLSKNDGGGVLHATSCIFEALGREICGIPGKKGRTFDKIFDDYSSKSSLPKKVLEYMRDIYITRNQEPNSGHGNISGEASISKQEMVSMVEIARAAIHIEDKLRN